MSSPVAPRPDLSAICLWAAEMQVLQQAPLRCSIPRTRSSLAAQGHGQVEAMSAGQRKMDSLRSTVRAGVGPGWLVASVVLPNALPPIIVAAPLAAESYLAYNPLSSLARSSIAGAK